MRVGGSSTTDPLGCSSVREINDHWGVVARPRLALIQPLFTVDEGACDALGEGRSAKNEVDLEALVSL